MEPFNFISSVSTANSEKNICATANNEPVLLNEHESEAAKASGCNHQRFNLFVNDYI